MAKQTLCIVHNNVDTASSIGKIALGTVRQALDAGWDVTVVARDLDPWLRDRVTWLPLYVPPRLHLVQWLVARPTIRAALGGRRFDILHVYQPQVAALADVMHCQFLTRAAYERHCLASGRSWRSRLLRAQQQGVLLAEDYYFRHWNRRTRLLFCSEMLQTEFHRLYRAAPREGVLVNAAPPLALPSDADRREARARLVSPDWLGLVVGYLGGIDPRKGYTRLIAALRDAPEFFLLLGGPGSAGFQVPELGERYRAIGNVRDLAGFYAACDVFVVPSVFEPLGLVAFEAAAHGTPIIASPAVGALPYLLEFGAGLAWPAEHALPPLLTDAVRRRRALNAGAAWLTDELSEKRQGAHLLAVYQEILRDKRDGSVRKVSRRVPMRV